MKKSVSIVTLVVAAFSLCQSPCAYGKSPWTPAETNTWGWWDPSAAGNMATNAGGGVTTLTDLSGNNRNMYAGAGKEPTAFTRLIGSLYGLDYDVADNDFLRKTSLGWNNLATNGAFAIFAVFDHDSGSTSIMNFQDNLYFTRSSLNPYGKRGGNGTLSFIGGPYAAPAIFNANINWHAAGTLPLSYFNAFVDGSQVTTNRALVTQFPTANAPHRITFLTGNSTDGSMDGALGEVVIVEDVSDVSRQVFEGYLAWKWGLVDSLPADHPYESWPPGLGPPGTVLILQ